MTARSRRPPAAPVVPDKPNFYVVDQLLEAADHRRRAAILLRLPDDLVRSKARVLRQACVTSGFTDGAAFIDVRVAAHCAKRMPAGELPKPVVDQVEYWRNGLAAIAGARP